MYFIALFAMAQAVAPVVGASEPVARTPLQNFITLDDFPAGVERSAARAVGFTLTIGPDGRVTGCRIIASSGSAALDNTTCRLLRSRSRFTPASNPRGTPVSGEVKAVIDWKALLDSGTVPPPVRTSSMPTQLTPRAPWESVSRLRVQRGQISSCQWQSTGPVPPPFASNACQNSGLAAMAMRLAAENKVDFSKSEVVVTLRMPGGGFIEPFRAAPAALVDLASELDIDAEGRLTDCRFTRDHVRSAAPQKPDCRTMFAGPYGRVTNRQNQAIATRNLAELRVEAR